MAVLFNINDLFAIDSSGAMEISGGAGAATYVLMSNGAGNANSWYDVQSKFSEYLPLTGGTLTGNLALTDATNNPSLVISTGTLTVGGVTELNASTTIIRDSTGYALRLDSADATTDQDLRFAKGGVDYAAIQVAGATNSNFQFYVNDGTNWINTLNFARADGQAYFTKLVSGITPTAAANFATKAYVDGIGGGVSKIIASTNITISPVSGLGDVTISANNSGTVTSVGGTGSVSGITLTGTVTSTGDLTLGGTLSASITNISDATRWWNNFGDNHSTRTGFDASTASYGFGWRYVQGNTNGPGTGGDQFYSAYVGLGNEYPSTGTGSYGAYLAFDRNVANPYLSIRYNEANALSTWRKISAGTADILTTARTIAGVSFNGSANISLNNNAITNGAGYITSYVNTTYSAGNGITFTGTPQTVINANINYISYDGSNNFIDLGSNLLGSAIPSQGIILYRETSNLKIVSKGYVEDLPFTNNSGTVTSVATGNGITGGTITATGTVSLTGTYTGRWNGTTGYYIKDTRASDITPADSTDNAMNLGFTNQVPGNGNWQSYIQMKGWSDGYTSWQIIGPSTTTAYENWYLRSGIGSTWNTARQIWHSGNLPNPTQGGPYLPLAGGTVTGLTNLLAGSKIVVQNSTNGGSSRGIFMWNNTDANWGIYMSTPGSTQNIAGGTAPSGLNGESSHSIRFRIANGAANGFIWENSNNATLMSMNGNSGNLTTGASMRSPIFYDSNNTSYYVDPGSDISAILAGSVGINNTSPIVTAWGTASATKQLTITGSTYGVLNLQGSATALTKYSMGVGNNKFHMAYDNIAGRHNIICESNGSVVIDVDVKSPIYYDKNNTAYYADPSAMSSLWGVAIRGDNDSTGTGNQIFFWGSSGHTTSAIGFKANGGSFVNPTGNGDGYNTYLTMDTDGRGWVFRRGAGGANFTSAYTAGWILNNGIFQANASMRAPIFYDSNNTAYYGDFASTSQLNVLNCAGTLTVTGAGGVVAPKFTDYNNGSFYLDPSSTGTSLNVAGDVVAYASSDIRFKNNITPITNALDKLSKIGGYTFEWNEISHKETGKKDIGVVAQEVEEILPEIVDTRDNGYKAVDYSKLTALLIQSVKEQQTIINDLKSRIENLENN